ncbi:uncharacterized protein LTHEOB_4955 [Lasiodiplodia theobromae]|uniref:Uncharacterized protein n=1 Tax=Lasiodiplodia theobromae TaxID=45133 RepID=A0A5N5DEI2_9PEZI|nr:uncharacterized protein LTHEOB_4955 [Lasiodiplodia theobromae]KAB2576199.1 hypothetical protein DBV05_g5189 [Lasiodiplodia theobromae]KAF4545696.1 hypothetical protein LTHEOB_4955 [Lasiodiplodia theobromae]
MIWLRLLEVWATTRLLSSPAFHRAVQNAYRRFHRLRHGTPMEEMGGTNIDRNQGPSFFKHFIDEIKEQLRNTPRR